MGLWEDGIDEVFDALGSETARSILNACYESGKTKSELSEEVDTSIQNVLYHVSKLESADLIEPAAIRYGENGREVAVYEPTREALVIAAAEPGIVVRIKRTLGKIFAPLFFLISALTVGVIGTKRSLEFGLLASQDVPSTISLIAWFVFMLFFILGIAIVIARGVCSFKNRPGRHGLNASLYGEQPVISDRYLAIAGFIFLGTILILDVAINVHESRFSRGAWMAIGALTVLGAGLASIQSYLNDGIIVSWSLAGAAILGVSGYFIAVSVGNKGFHIGPLIVLIGVLIWVVFPIGTLSYLLGLSPRYRIGGNIPPRRFLFGLLVYATIAAGSIALWFILVVNIR